MTEERKGERCGRGGRAAKWAWLVLAVAVAGVLLARSAAKRPEAPTATATAARELSLPRLVDLGAGKCIPCKLMAPILEELKKTHAGKLEVVFIDVWENPDAAKTYGVRTIPTQIFYDTRGQELFRHEGFLAREDILSKWRELGVDLSARTNSAPAAPATDAP